MPGPADPARAGVTGEVGSEGGAPGDVELDIDRGPGTGSEAGETWRPGRDEVTEIVRDETGQGRRSQRYARLPLARRRPFPPA